MNNIIKPEPVIIFIFGGSGDLANRKLIPALYNLYLDGYMPEQFRVVGLGRTKFTDAQYRKEMNEGVNDHSRQKGSKETWEEFAKNVHYLVSDVFADKSYEDIEKMVDKAEKDFGAHPNVIFNLAIAPGLMDDAVIKLGESGVCQMEDADF